MIVIIFSRYAFKNASLIRILQVYHDCRDCGKFGFSVVVVPLISNMKLQRWQALTASSLYSNVRVKRGDAQFFI